MMIKTRIKIFALFVLVSLQFSAYAATTISGLWQHASKPALLAFNLETGLAIVKQHDENKDASGLTIIKNITEAAQQKDQWIGEMYNGYIDSYVPVIIKLSGEETLLVYDSEGEEVLRLYRE